MSLKRVVCSSLVGILLLSATPALAGTPRVLSHGARGADVSLLQRLLTHQGHPVAITSLIGPTTEGLIKEFQAHESLAATGVVDSGTWRKLYPTLRAGNRGGAVKALQLALAEKHGYQVAATGVYDAGTVAKVREFQRHMGIMVDGITGPQTWGALVGHLQALGSSGPGWYRYGTLNSDGANGTAHTIATVKMVAEEWARRGHSAIGVGDISLPHGGPMPGHASHQRGVDVDLRVFRHDGNRAPVSFRHDAYSRRLTQELVDLLLSTGEVELIFFNDPGVRGVTYWPNHDSHMHVRFRR